MNFNITDVEATEPSWGSLNEDGSWSGIMGKFYNLLILRCPKEIEGGKTCLEYFPPSSKGQKVNY